ncbi:hypothetical protein P3T76_001509 [Phytophthora citrophthora]|uniref:Uncharacterized protein n=1 Tax=Phytophthora citrophthora TaxID=4793 RepID=A0AAD9LUS5_9STRA|nr:hypothetical protein P3T76_001509 [Phytophthora citrophthora]
MSSVGAVESFAAAMEETGTNVQCEDLVKLYPPLSSFSESKSIDLEKCKFFDLFDTDPAEPRAIMEKKRKDAEVEHGAAYMWEISNSRKHHPLKQNRRYDLRLKPDEKERLAANGVIACERFMYRGFGNIYYNLYSDDLPVTTRLWWTWRRSA